MGDSRNGIEPRNGRVWDRQGRTADSYSTFITNRPTFHNRLSSNSSCRNAGGCTSEGDWH